MISQQRQCKKEYLTENLIKVLSIPTTNFAFSQNVRTSIKEKAQNNKKTLILEHT